MVRTVIDFLKRTYEAFPEKTACVNELSSISYRELWEDSHRIADHLFDLVRIGEPVPVLMKKSCAALKVIWGIIKAGGCYVMIDPSLPKVRIESILRTLHAGWLISDRADSAKVPDPLKVYPLAALLLPQKETGMDRVAQRCGEICDIDPLYIMFTSGSTGVPKGIVASHRSVVDFITCFTDLFYIDERDVIGNQAPWDFDVSVKDIFSSARTGATLQIIPKKYFSFPAQLVDFLDERQVTTLIWAVSALNIISSRGALARKRPGRIQKIIFSGEVMPVKQYNIWRSYYPEALFVNVYGPTEITCNCTYHIVDGLYAEGKVIPIGSPFPNERVFLLDADDRLISGEKKDPELVGEICVSGTAVTMGYYDNCSATDLAFVQNPLNQRYIEIIYRTGDLGYYNEDGILCYRCRKDFQIKHLGHRIELTEIERAIHSVPGVANCCCIYQNPQIFALYEGQAEPGTILSTIRQILPSYMIPGKLLHLDQMPLNRNGKIDRTKLTEYLE